MSSNRFGNDGILNIFKNIKYLYYLKEIHLSGIINY